MLVVVERRNAMDHGCPTGTAQTVIRLTNHALICMFPFSRLYLSYSRYIGKPRNLEVLPKRTSTFIHYPVVLTYHSGTLLDWKIG